MKNLIATGLNNLKDDEKNIGWREHGLSCCILSIRLPRKFAILLLVIERFFLKFINAFLGHAFTQEPLITI